MQPQGDLPRSDNEMSLDERLALFNMETVDVESDANTEYRARLDKLAINTVGRIIGKSVPGFQWLLKQLPSVYTHEHSTTSGRLSHR